PPITNDTPQTAIKILLPWKYSKERLAKHPYCAYIVRIKKVICHCGKVIKPGHRYDETFLNIHVNSKGCLAKQEVQLILNYFKLISKSKKIKSDNCVSSAEEWESDDDENMGNNDLFKIDEISNVKNDCESEVLSADNMIIPLNNKWKPCSGLRSSIIHEYISRTPAQFGETRRIEVIAKEIFPNLFLKEFSRKKLDCSQKSRFKQFLDSIEYDNPIAAITDNIKLKLCLRYSSRIGCIIGFTFSNHETNIKIYDDISVTINKIKENNTIAKYVRVYILQVPLSKFLSVIIALLSNLGSDKTETILDIYKLLLDFAQELKLHIISIGSDGVQVEFNVQT
ncbi:17738_t:CDS:2, partial [Racocetra persica]